MLFGKLPAHGDFVSRGLAAEERDALDAWLSASLNDARERCGDAFEALFDAAPAWRFADGARAGVLAASMDKAGRRFPLWLAVEGGSCGDCEDLLYRALAEGWDADLLLARAAALAPEAGPPPHQGWWIEDAAGAVVAHSPDPRPADLLHAMLTVREKVFL
jgi:type VI secretion system protein ImpM